MQHTAFNQLNITKQIFLNTYHFPSTLVLLKYQDPFIMVVFNPAYLAAFLFELRISAFIIPYSSKVYLNIFSLQLLFKSWSGPDRCCFNYESIN